MTTGPSTTTDCAFSSLLVSPHHRMQRSLFIRLFSSHHVQSMFFLHNRKPSSFTFRPPWEPPSFMAQLFVEKCTNAFYLTLSCCFTLVDRYLTDSALYMLKQYYSLILSWYRALEAGVRTNKVIEQTDSFSLIKHTNIFKIIQEMNRTWGCDVHWYNKVVNSIPVFVVNRFEPRWFTTVRVTHKLKPSKNT